MLKLLSAFSPPKSNYFGEFRSTSLKPQSSPFCQEETQIPGKSVQALPRPQTKAKSSATTKQRVVQTPTSQNWVGLIFFGEQKRGHRAVRLRNNPQLVASVCAVGAQEAGTVL